MNLLDAWVIVGTVMTAWTALCGIALVVATSILAFSDRDDTSSKASALPDN